MKVILGISLLLLVVFCNQNHGSSHETRSQEKVRELKLLERIEEILEKRENEESTALQQARQDVEEALEEGDLKLERLMKIQKEKKGQGVDGKRKPGLSRQFKSTPNTRRRQYKAYNLIAAKKALVKITGKSLKELAGDTDYVKAWEEATKTGDSRIKRQGGRQPGGPRPPPPPQPQPTPRPGPQPTPQSTTTTPKPTQPTTGSCDGIDNVNQYRTMDGTCNNLVNTDWGSAGAQAPRFQTEVYQDGVDEPRLATSGGELPTPRTLSNTFFKVPNGQEAVREGFNTLMSMFWGQFLDHDFVLTPTITGEEGASITCCENGEPVDRDECMAMKLTPEPDLEFLSCMEFTRSQEAIDTSLTGKQVVNEITSFIDGSNVYGSSEEELRELRGQGAKMLVKGEPVGDLLPEDTADDAICFLDGNDSNDYCQKAGDVRVNVQPGLGLMHILFVREHNRIVDELKAIGWTDDEKIFNEARKIVGAEIQHITYNEYLDNVFTDETIRKYNLRLLDFAHSTSYNTSCNPGITVGFSTAAFRFGHSQVPNQLAYLQDANNPNRLTEETDMEDTLLNPHMIINQGGSKVLDFVRYSASLPASRVDSQFEDAIRNKLFHGPLDLTSLNINRGRDHGLPTYLQWRQWCGLSVPSSGTAFRELDDIPGPAVDELMRIYGNLNDIDLYVGGILERRLAGDPSYVGPTFACILGQQFKQLKECDRFWYERPAPEGFSLEQLDEIRKVTIAGVICDNAPKNDPTLISLQRAALERNNIRVSCEQRTNGGTIPRIDFRAWQGGR